MRPCVMFGWFLIVTFFVSLIGAFRAIEDFKRLEAFAQGFVIGTLAIIGHSILYDIFEKRGRSKNART